MGPPLMLSRLPNDPNAKDMQLLAPSCSSEKDHNDSNCKQNKTAGEIHEAI
jgi:hypothetical protein